MSSYKSRVISKIPLIGHLLHWDINHERTDDDGQGLLQDDPLSIPLGDRRLDSNDPLQRTGSPHHNNHRSWGRKHSPLPCHKYLVFRLPPLLRLGQVCAVATMIAFIFWLVLLRTKVESAQAVEGQILCGNQRYYINNVRISQLYVSYTNSIS